MSAPRAESKPVAPGIVASNEGAASDSGRGFAIVIDDLRIAPERTAIAQDGVKAFLERSVRDGDLVTLATTSGNGWWSDRIPPGHKNSARVPADTLALAKEGLEAAQTPSPALPPPRRPPIQRPMD